MASAVQDRPLDARFPLREGAFQAILAITLALSMLFWMRNLEEARILDPSLLHSLFTQGGPLSLTPYRLEDFPRPLLMDPSLEFGLMGYLVMLMTLPARCFLGSVFTPLGIAVTRSFVATMNLAGGPLLYLLARHSGLSPRSALLPALLYLGNPFLLDKVSWDILGCQGTLFIAAALALASSRPRWAIPAWILAAGGHPVSSWGAILWCLLEARRRVLQHEPHGRWFAAAAFGLGLLGMLFFLDLFLPPLLDLHGGLGLTFALKVGGPSPLERLPEHLLSLSALLLSLAFLPLAAPRWLPLVLADGLYYLILGPDHGSLPGTVGLLAVAAVEGLSRLSRRAIDPKPARWVRLVWPAAGLRPMGVAIAGMCLLLANLRGDSRNQVRRFFDPPHWDGAWVPEARELFRRLPEDVRELCLVQAPLLPLSETRCQQTRPFEDWARVMPWDRRRAHFLFHVDLFDGDRFVSRWTPHHEVLRRHLCTEYRRRRLRVRLAVGNAIYASAENEAESAPIAPSPPMEWLCRMSSSPENP